MEGINTLCLSIFFLPGVILVGGLIFLVTKAASGSFVKKKYGEKYKVVSLAISLVLGIFSACVLLNHLMAPSFSGYYHPKRRPNPNDIVGVWIPTNDSIEFMKERGYQIQEAHQIEFFENGDVLMVNMPDRIFWQNRTEFYSGKGRWEIVKDFQGYWQVSIVFSSIDPPYVPDPPLSGPTACPGKSVPCEGLPFSFDMWNRESPYYLFVNIGGELGPNFYLQRQGDVHDIPG